MSLLDFFMRPAHNLRRKALLAELKARKLDGLLVTHPANWFYLTGFTGEAGALLVTSGGLTLITDGRFTVQAAGETQGVKIEMQQGSLYPSVGGYLKKNRLNRMGFDANSLDRRRVGFAPKSRWKQMARHRGLWTRGAPTQEERCPGASRNAKGSHSGGRSP